MARIKHIAIATNDADGTRDFYTDIIGMNVVRSVEMAKYSGYILSDGYINLAILDFKQDDAAGTERGTAFEGLHHIGIQADPNEGVIEKLTSHGFKPRTDINDALGVKAGSASYNPTHEFKYQGPSGVVIDVSTTGWEGTSD